MIRYNIFILINFLILFCISCIKTVAFDYNLDQFLYPNPGVRNVYKGLDGDRMEIIGISNENKILDIQETIYFSKNSLPPDIPNSSTVSYKIIINNQKMVKQSIQTEEIILLDPKTQDSSKWKITGKMRIKLGQGKEKWSNIKSICRIINVEKQNILGEERCTVTTECITKNKSSSTIRIETYAEGIGLYERIIKGTLNEDETKELEKFTLEKVLKK